MALIFTITVTGILSNTLVVPAIPDILDAFDLPDSQAGVFVAAGTLPGIVMAPVIGILADRHGRRAVLVPGLASFGRSAERRVGKECVRTCRTRWSTDHYKKKLTDYLPN